jgi:exodeoxyribonuclease VIII
MSEIHVMLDLETLSTESNAAICSIGAVKFTFADGIIDEFYTVVDAKDCKNLGLHISKDTVKWWSQQDPKALEMLRKDPKSLDESLDAFTKWYGRRGLPTWGCGSDFDNVILTNAYKALDATAPWKFYLNRCYRTMKTIIAMPEDPREGTYHNALDDAKHQAKHLVRILSS